MSPLKAAGHVRPDVDHNYSRAAFYLRAPRCFYHGRPDIVRFHLYFCGAIRYSSNAIRFDAIRQYRTVRLAEELLFAIPPNEINFSSLVIGEFEYRSIQKIIIMPRLTDEDKIGHGSFVTSSRMKNESSRRAASTIIVLSRSMKRYLEFRAVQFDHD